MQEKPRTSLANAYRARERGVKDPSKPTVLLFAGCSGLGKTEMLKALARYHEGLENRPELAEQIKPVTINLNEYGDESSVSKITGANPGLVGYGEPIPWHDEIRKNPRSLVLFDEGDKAHPKVVQALMQACDAGELKDSSQKVVDFRDTIIVFNINGVSDSDIPDDKKDDAGFIFQKVLGVQSKAGGNLFTPEGLARFNGGIFIFENLDNDRLACILNKQLRKLDNDFHHVGIEVNIDDQAARTIIRAYPNQSGGRGPGQLIDKYLRPLLIKYIDERAERLPSDQIPAKETLKVGFDGKGITVAVAEPQPVPSGRLKTVSSQPQASPV